MHQLASESKAGRRVEQLISDPERMLSTLLVANNIVNVLAAAVATTLFIGLVGEQWGPWLATAAVTAVILVFGEITPKTLATRYPERFALAVAPAIWQLSRVLAPLASFFGAITRGILRLLRVPVRGDSGAVTDADIRALAELGHRDGQIEEVERKIIDALFDLADRPIRDVMTPRVDIVSLTAPVTMDEVREAVATTGHSRFPVTGGDLDDLLGMLFVKDLLQRSVDATPDDIATLLRFPQFMPETATILDALTEMRQRKFAIACVVDEHGGVEGIITAKDLLAELVGELQDEYDPGVPSVVRIGPTTMDRRRPPPHRGPLDRDRPVASRRAIQHGRGLLHGDRGARAGRGRLDRRRRCAAHRARYGAEPGRPNRRLDHLTERQDGNGGTIPAFGT